MSTGNEKLVAFIHQEAEEKVREIELKTEMEVDLEKNMFVHKERQKLDAEYEVKHKQITVDERVKRSAAYSKARVSKMEARSTLLDTLKESVRTKLADFVKTEEYKTLLRQLIVQGLVKIEEQVIEIQGREKDRALIEQLIPSAVAEYKTKMAAAGHTVEPGMPRVNLSAANFQDSSITGGVILLALNGRIVCNQTLDERLAIAYSELMPSVRNNLFPEI